MKEEITQRNMNTFIMVAVGSTLFRQEEKANDGKGAGDRKSPVNFIYMHGGNMDDLQETVTEIESHAP